MVARNEDWRDDADTRNFLTATQGYGVQMQDRDSALLLRLAPGAYTFHVGDDLGGEVLLDAYDLEEESPQDTGGLRAFSARTKLPGSGLLIGGVAIGGSQKCRLVVRGLGPTLATQGVSNTMSDPQITLFQDGKAWLGNDNWRNDWLSRKQFRDLQLPPLIASSRDAAAIVTLPPGNYTVQLSDKKGHGGDACLELYYADPDDASYWENLSWPDRDWTYSIPESEGMSSDILNSAGAYNDQYQPKRFSLLVIRNGRMVYEHYSHGAYASQITNIKSVSKSILSLLTGVALENKVLTGVDQPLSEGFPDYYLTINDPLKRNITLRHMLTMTAGLEWEENGAIDGSWHGSRDWLRFTLDQRLVSAPGALFNYSTPLTHLLTAWIGRAAFVSPLDYLRQKLLIPLDTQEIRWDQDPRGNYCGGWEMYLRPRDLAKIGLLVLRHGRWKDQQLVPDNWIAESTRTQQKTSGTLQQIGDYGYLWWTSRQQGFEVIAGSGYGGQYIFIVPALDLVMVTTARYDSDDGTMHYDAFSTLNNYIIRAVTDR